MNTFSKPHRFILLLAAFLIIAIAEGHTQVAGSLDPGYDPVLDGNVSAIALQPDGKAIIGGGFSSVDGVTRWGIARLNEDGSVDTTFVANVAHQFFGGDFPGAVYGIAIQSNGKIVILGSFDTVNGTPRSFLARLDSDGSLDSSFDAGTTAVFNPYCMALQPDGRILIGGEGSHTPHALARLHPDGTPESTATFNVEIGHSDIPTVYSIAVQPDGKILIGGYFETVNGSGRNGVARLNSDGSLESLANFNPGSGANGGVSRIALYPDGSGRILLGGWFSVVDGFPRNGIARLYSSGAVENLATFNPGTGTADAVYCVTSQSDGKILVGGELYSVNGAPRDRIARLHLDGSLETSATFNVSIGIAGESLYCMAVQTDGRIIVGGDFTRVNGVTRSRIARLRNGAAAQSLTVPISNRIEWLRTDTSPAVTQVSFDYSGDGVTWGLLGQGTRIPGGWELATVIFPSGGRIRARAQVFDGATSSGHVETQSILSPTDSDGDGLRDAWELSFWGTKGEHYPTDDSDHDGLTELQELAFGLNPTVADSSLAPSPIDEAGFHTITLTKQPGVIYEVQTAGTLLEGQPNSFSPATTTVLIDNATTLKVRDNFPIGTPPARFMRVKVIAAP